ncbi:MAG: flippase-like domain-containing protein [Anaerolineae bacterium]|nr:flippase-like domain-containing protein [Anaerolineae bacterium]
MGADRDPARRAARKQAWSWIIGGGVAILSLWLLTRELDWSQVGDALRGVHYGWLLLGVAAIVGTFFTRAWRWQALLWQARLPLLPTLTALLVGQVVSLALPMMRSGDVARSVWIAPQRGTNAPEALGSVVLEKVWDLLALLVCGLLLLAWMPLPLWFSQSTWGTALILAAGTAVLWAGLRWQEVLLRWVARLLAFLPVGWDQALMPKLRSLAQGVASLKDSRASMQALAWTLLTWGLGALANWAVLMAFGISSPPAALLLLSGLMVGSAVVPVPGRLGVYEGVSVVCLALFGVPRDIALAVGLALRVVVMGPPLIGAGALALVSQALVRRGNESV